MKPFLRFTSEQSAPRCKMDKHQRQSGCQALDCLEQHMHALLCHAQPTPPTCDFS